MPNKDLTSLLIKKCEHIAPGQIGLCRKTMINRETLQRPRTGKLKNRGRPKQKPGFTYGMQIPIIPNEITRCMNWPIKEKGDGVDPKCLPRDFHRINVESTKVGIHPVPAWLQFAKEKDYRLNPTKRVLGRLRRPHFPDDMTFGLEARPNTPMACIISHRYKTLWNEHAYKLNKERMSMLSRAEDDTPQPIDSVASILNMLPLGALGDRSKYPEDSRERFWQIHRFQQKTAKLNTHWSREEAKVLLRQH